MVVVCKIRSKVKASKLKKDQFDLCNGGESEKDSILV